MRSAKASVKRDGYWWVLAGLQAVLISVAPVAPCMAQTVWDQGLVVYLEEYSLPSRSGTLVFYRYNPLNRNAAFMDVEQICTSNIFMAGGIAAGWIEELIVDDASILSPLASMMIATPATAVEPQDLAEISNLMFFIWPNMGPRSYSSGLVVSYGTSLGDGSFGENHLCGGSVVNEEGFFVALFQSPFPTTSPSNWIGDFLVCGEATAACEWYGMYRSPPRNGF